jgi:type I restriction enzyme R subunit
MNRLRESHVEEAALAWPETLGWPIAHGPDIAPDMPAAERANYSEVVLGARLRDALAPNRGDAPSKTTDEPCLRIGMRNGCA